MHMEQRAVNVLENGIQFPEGCMHHLRLVQLRENSSSRPGNRKSNTTLRERGARVMFNIQE